MLVELDDGGDSYTLEVAIVLDLEQQVPGYIRGSGGRIQRSAHAHIINDKVQTLGARSCWYQERINRKS